jgi:hypothetical protein
MKQEFVPYELAVKLKQLGFDEECFGYYHNLGSKQLVISLRNLKEDNNSEIQYFLAPTYSQAFRWFREHQNGSLYHLDFMYKYLKYSSMSYEQAELAALDKLIKILESKQQEQ